MTETFGPSSVLAHATEHLTFAASKHYPWSNVLDDVAGRLLTQGVNASTSSDNITYTVESASETGLLELVSICLDHILFPSFSEETFKTEIYHINGKGEEGGVSPIEPFIDLATTRANDLYDRRSLQKRKGEKDPEKMSWLSLSIKRCTMLETLIAMTLEECYRS